MATRPPGFALVLVAGLLALLISLSLFLAAPASAAARSNRIPRMQARIAAGSGLEYAAARLTEEPSPRRTPSMRNRGDDWTDRGDIDNPSYNHGEPWNDDGDGIYEPEVPAERNSFLDADGDGRFSARSGRLRAARRPASFSLAIECAEGKLPLHFPADAEQGRYQRNGVVHALNNLGARLLDPRGNVRWNERRGRHDFQLSRLGDDLLARAPPGGYGSPERIRTALSDAGYLPGEVDAVLPFIDPGPFDPQEESARVSDLHGGVHSWSVPPHIPVNLSVAPPEVLESLWRYLFLRFDHDVMEQVSPWNVACPRSGLRYDQLFLSAVIYPEEARRLADLVVRLRAQSPLSWTMLRAAIIDTAALLFAEDHATLAPLPLLQRSWTLAKADLSFRGIACDLFSAQTGPASACHGTWGMIPRPFCRAAQIARVDPPDLWNRYNDAHHPFRRFDNGSSNNRTKIFPVGGTISPPRRFDVRALGASGPARIEAAGRWVASERLEFTSQEDFENLSGGFHLARRGIRPAPEGPAAWEARRDHRDLDPAAGETAAFYDNGPLLRRVSRIVSLPKDNIRAYTGLIWGQDYRGYPRAWGALGLASREWGLGPVPGAQLYWAVRDDFDHVRNNWGSPDPRTDPFWEADLWHERPAAFAPWEPSGAAAPETILATAHAVTKARLGFHPAPPFRMPGAIPGRDGNNGDPVAGFSVEARVGPGSYLLMTGTQEIRMDVWPAIGGNGNRELVFELQFDAGGSCAASVLDTEQSAGTPVLRHMVLTAAYDAPNSRLSLFVDGNLAPLDGFPTHRHGYPFLVGGITALEFYRLDEVRIYDRELQADEARILANLDRFMRKGTHVSPLYAFDAPARMRQVQWTGIVPPGFPPTSLAVVVEGFSDAAGTSPVFQAPLAPSGPPEALPSGAIRSFRYRVLFDVPASVPAPLVDTPVFESIWFAFHPAGGGRWTAFEDQ